MAEGVGFEPTVALRLLLISSQMPLTTQPPFQPFLPADRSVRRVESENHYARIPGHGKLIWKPVFVASASCLTWSRASQPGGNKPRACQAACYFYEPPHKSAGLFRAAGCRPTRQVWRPGAAGFRRSGSNHRPGRVCFWTGVP